MTQRNINIGTSAHDGTGTALRDAGDSINKNFSELYTQANRMLDLMAFTISDVQDKYAHESQILIHVVEDKTLLLVMYQSDKISETESELTAHATLKVYELTTKVLLKTLDMFAPGMSAGVTMDANSNITAPHMYISGNSLICFVGNSNTLYTRTVDITNSDPTTWAAGNISISQMTMKNNEGQEVLANVTSTNVQTHLENVLGDTNAGYVGLAPFLRNLDKICVVSSNWYCILELSDKIYPPISTIAVLLKSTDNGLSWSFTSLPGYNTSTREKMMETTVCSIGTTLHTITRDASGSIKHFSSDDGLSWSARSFLPINTIYSKPTVINYYKHDGTIGILLAASLVSEIQNNTHRTTLCIYETSDFNFFTEVAKIITGSYAHYPSLCHFSRSLYLSYTKGLKFNTDGHSNTSHDRNTIVVTKIY